MMPNKLYTLPSIEKEKELLDNLNLRLQLHYESSLEFRRIINGFFADKLPAKSLKNLPFIPVRLFKTLDLKSVVDSDIVDVRVYFKLNLGFKVYLQPVLRIIRSEP